MIMNSHKVLFSNLFLNILNVIDELNNKTNMNYFDILSNMNFNLRQTKAFLDLV